VDGGGQVVWAVEVDRMAGAGNGHLLEVDHITPKHLGAATNGN
jgi:hypothetical protein